MLTFTEAATNLLSTKQAKEDEKRGDEELQVLLSNFVHQLSSISAYARLQSPTAQDSLNSEIKAVITKKNEPLPKPTAEETDPRCFVSGKYDAIIFSENPKSTAEFQTIINKYNREFIQTLFHKCQSKNQIQFWLTHAPAELPFDSIPLAISLGCNIHALQYLKEQGWFKKNFSKIDKLELLARGNRFKNTPGYDYLLKECGLQVSPTQKFSTK